MSKPTHIAYVVNPPKEGSDKKAVWHAVGAVWPHSKGGGFDVVIHDQLSVSGLGPSADVRLQKKPINV